MHMQSEIFEKLYFLYTSLCYSSLSLNFKDFLSLFCILLSLVYRKSQGKSLPRTNKEWKTFDNYTFVHFHLHMTHILIIHTHVATKFRFLFRSPFYYLNIHKNTNAELKTAAKQEWAVINNLNVSLLFNYLHWNFTRFIWQAILQHVWIFQGDLIESNHRYRQTNFKIWRPIFIPS